MSMTPHDLVHGMRQGVVRVLELATQPAAAVERFIHSTPGFTCRVDEAANLLLYPATN